MTAPLLRLVLTPPAIHLKQTVSPFSESVAALAAAVRCIEAMADQSQLSAAEARQLLRDHLRAHAKSAGGDL